MNQKGFTVVELIIAVFGLAVVVGWIMNVVEVFKAISDPITGMFILRAIGIVVAPLGAVLGFL